MASSFTLLDPRPIAENARYTFFLPSHAEIAAVRTGDLVKLTFEYTHKVEKWPIERMWVTVQSISDMMLVGRLENQPFETTSSLKIGDTIDFQRHQIVSIQWACPENAPPSGKHREYWERCLVDDCVLNGTTPIEYIYREEPDMQQDGDEHPDSGWRIRGRVDDAGSEELSGEKPQYVAIGAVLNRDDSWLDLIDAPIGSHFMRNFTTGTYDQQP